MLIRIFLLTGILTFIYVSISHSQALQQLEGYVTYLSSQNVYVKFDDTRGINPGDTLFIPGTGNPRPVIRVKYISTRSAAGELLNSVQVNVNDKIIAFTPAEEIKENVNQLINEEKAGITLEEKSPGLLNKKETNEKYSGRFSIQSLSGFSNTGKIYDIQRWRYTLSFKGDGSPLSFTSFMNFSYRADQWQSVKSDPGRSLRIYDLALNYKPAENLNLWLGRYINRRIYGISAIDGLQAEYSFPGFYLGAAAGSRPEFSDMGYNLKLFGFGGYIGRTDTTGRGLMENTLAVFQQTNDFVIDRRFLYFQHSNNNLIPRTSVFFSSEVDLYKKASGKAENDFSLTGIFTSIRYSPVKEISAALSYDARRNVIYYETFRNFIDSLIENETRQGLRGNLNIRPINNIYIGLGAGWRYRKGDLRPSNNFNGYITWAAVPYIINSATFTYNNISSSFLEGIIYGAGIYRNIQALNIDLGLNYRNTQYTFNTFKQTQNSLTADLGLNITRQLHITTSYEGIFEKEKTSTRIFIDLTARM